MASATVNSHPAPPTATNRKRKKDNRGGPPLSLSLSLSQTGQHFSDSETEHVSASSGGDETDSTKPPAPLAPSEMEETESDDASDFERSRIEQRRLFEAEQTAIRTANRSQPLTSGRTARHTHLSASQPLPVAVAVRRGRSSIVKRRLILRAPTASLTGAAAPAPVSRSEPIMSHTPPVGTDGGDDEMYQPPTTPPPLHRLTTSDTPLGGRHSPPPPVVMPASPSPHSPASPQSPLALTQPVTPPAPSVPVHPLFHVLSAKFGIETARLHWREPPSTLGQISLTDACMRLIQTPPPLPPQPAPNDSARSVARPSVAAALGVVPPPPPALSASAVTDMDSLSAYLFHHFANKYQPLRWAFDQREHSAYEHAKKGVTEMPLSRKQMQTAARAGFTDEKHSAAAAASGSGGGGGGDDMSVSETEDEQRYSQSETECDTESRPVRTGKFKPLRVPALPEQDESTDNTPITYRDRWIASDTETIQSVYQQYIKRIERNQKRSLHTTHTAGTGTGKPSDPGSVSISTLQKRAVLLASLGLSQQINPDSDTESEGPASVAAAAASAAGGESIAPRNARLVVASVLTRRMTARIQSLTADMHRDHKLTSVFQCRIGWTLDRIKSEFGKLSARVKSKSNRMLWNEWINREAARAGAVSRVTARDRRKGVSAFEIRPAWVDHSARSRLLKFARLFRLVPELPLPGQIADLGLHSAHWMWRAIDAREAAAYGKWLAAYQEHFKRPLRLVEELQAKASAESAVSDDETEPALSRESAVAANARSASIAVNTQLDESDEPSIEFLRDCIARDRMATAPHEKSPHDNTSSSAAAAAASNHVSSSSDADPREKWSFLLGSIGVDLVHDHTPVFEWLISERLKACRARWGVWWDQAIEESAQPIPSFDYARAMYVLHRLLLHAAWSVVSSVTDTFGSSGRHSARVPERFDEMCAYFESCEWGYAARSTPAMKKEMFAFRRAGGGAVVKERDKSATSSQASYYDPATSDDSDSDYRSQSTKRNRQKQLRLTRQRLTAQARAASQRARSQSLSQSQSQSSQPQAVVIPPVPVPLEHDETSVCLMFPNLLLRKWYHKLLAVSSEFPARMAPALRAKSQRQLSPYLDRTCRVVSRRVVVCRVVFPSPFALSFTPRLV